MSALYLMNFTQLEGLNHIEQKISGLKSQPLKHEERLAHCLNGRLTKKTNRKACRIFPQIV